MARATKKMLFRNKFSINTFHPWRQHKRITNLGKVVIIGFYVNFHTLFKNSWKSFWYSILSRLSQNSQESCAFCDVNGSLAQSTLISVEKRTWVLKELHEITVSWMLWPWYWPPSRHSVSWRNGSPSHTQVFVHCQYLLNYGGKHCLRWRKAGAS